MATDQTTLAIQAALKANAPTLSADLVGGQGDLIMNLLDTNLFQTPNEDPSVTLTAVSNPQNSTKIQFIENLWVKSKKNAVSTIDKQSVDVTSSRNLQATQSNTTAVRLAYLTTVGFFALIFCMIFLDRLPCGTMSCSSPAAEGTPQSASTPSPAPGTAAPGTSAPPAQGNATLGSNNANQAPHNMPMQNSAYKDILLTLMGVIGTGWAGIISFYFGSSVGSRQQSETLQDISRGAVNKPAGTG